MADEPNNKMDDLLKAYSRKRREESGAPLEMHPANRRMLQAEVARLTPKPQSSSAPRNALLALLPRFGFALSILIVLAVVFWSLQAPKQSSQLARVAPSAAPALDDSKQVVHEDRLERRKDSDLVEELESKKAVADEGAKEVDGVALRRLERADADVKLKAEREVRQQAGQRAPSPADVNKTDAPLAVNAPAPTMPESKTTAEVAAAAGVAGDYGIAATNATVRKGELADSQFAKVLNAGEPAAALTVYYRNVPAASGASSSNVLLGAVAAAQPTPGSATVVTPGLSSDKDQSLLASTEANVKKPASEAFLYDETATNGRAPTSAKRSDPFDTQLAFRFQAVDAEDQLREQLRPDRSSGASAVLATFNFERVGQQVRLTDADGSVYEGLVTAQKTADSTFGPAGGRALNEDELSRRDRARRLQPDALQKVAAELAFEAKGTNRTLKQLVVVNGTMHATPSAATNQTRAFSQPAPASAPSTVESRLARQAKDAAAPAETLGATRVSEATEVVNRLKARVRVGPSNELNLEAIPVRR